MSNIKTPLQLVNGIQNCSVNLFEIRRISKALKVLAASADYETLKITTKALSTELEALAGINSDIYWMANDLQKAITAQVLEETADADDVEPITDGEEVTADDFTVQVIPSLTSPLKTRRIMKQNSVAPYAQTAGIS